MQLVKMVNHHLVVGVVVPVGTEDPREAAHLMDAIEALSEEVDEIAVHLPEVEADPLITAHMLDLGVEAAQNDSLTRTNSNYLLRDLGVGLHMSICCLLWISSGTEVMYWVYVRYSSKID